MLYEPILDVYWSKNKEFQSFINKKKIENGQRAIKIDRKTNLMSSLQQMTRQTAVNTKVPLFNPKLPRIFLPTDLEQIIMFFVSTGDVSLKINNTTIKFDSDTSWYVQVTELIRGK